MAGLSSSLAVHLTLVVDMPVRQGKKVGCLHYHLRRMDEVEERDQLP
jgi:hypothetical protein